MKAYTCNEISNLICGKVLYWDSEKIIETFSQYPSPPLPNSLYFIRERITDEVKLFSKLDACKPSGIIIDKSYQLNLEKYSSKGIGVILVKNIHQAYLDILCFYRKQFSIPFIQVIGSSGKTTTKEIIGSILKTKLNPLVSHENMNSPFGVAFNISKLRDIHQAAVLESGMRAKGAIAVSTNLIRPDFVIVTCIHRAHLVTLGSIEEIIAAKSEFIDFMSPESTVIINGDDENCKKLPLHRHKGKTLTFGFSEACDIWAKEIQCKDFKMHFKACTKNLEFDCTINTIGKYNVLNALSAILLGLSLGFSPQEIQKGLSQFQPIKKRLQITKGSKNFYIINDTFNANPDSTTMLIDEIQYFSHGNPVILVLGDFENPNYIDPAYPRAVHYEVGKKAAGAMLYKLIAIGKWADAVISGAVENGFPAENTRYFAKAEDAVDFLDKSIIASSIVLFKSSIHTDLTKLINSMEDDRLVSSTEEDGFAKEKIDISESKNKRVIVDIDGVLAIEQDNKPYALREPVKQAVESLKTLKRLGFEIILHTSRFPSESNVTIAWLKANGFEYDQIKFGKPRGNIYIDDRGYRFNDWDTFFRDVKIN